MPLAARLPIVHFGKAVGAIGTALAAKSMSNRPAQESEKAECTRIVLILKRRKKLVDADTRYLALSDCLLNSSANARAIIDIFLATECAQRGSFGPKSPPEM